MLELSSPLWLVSVSCEESSCLWLSTVCGVVEEDGIDGSIYLLQGSDVETVDETVHLDRGENLFEIHISKVCRHVVLELSTADTISVGVISR